MILDVSRNGRGVAVLYAVNAASTIVQTVNHLIACGLHVVAVDDASTDDTTRQARLTGAEVIRNRERLGLGRSLLNAWRLALDYRPDYVVTTDGSIDGVRNLIEATEHTDIAVGFHRPLPWDGQVVTGLCNLVQPRKYGDWLCGVRVYRSDVLLALLRHGYYANGRMFHAETLARCHQLGCTVASLPVGGNPCPLTAQDWREVWGTWLRVVSIPVATTEVREIESPW